MSAATVVPATPAPADVAARGRLPHRAAPPPSRGRGRGPLSTPAALRALLAGLVLLSLAWGGFGGWVAAEHASAARSLATADEPLSVDAQRMYEAIADADATITAALLASAQPPLSSLQRYRGDVATASAELAALRAGDGSRQAAASLAALSGGLPVYAGYVAEAQSEYATGYPLTGGSFVQVASEEAHLVLLPAAKNVFTRENAAVSAASGQANGLPLALAALVLAIVAAVVLYRAQRWLARRTNRLFSPGLVLASVLLVVSTLWLAAGFLGARSDLDRGLGGGSGPAQNLALASIGVQQIRGDAVLNVISRSGSTSFADDFAATSGQIGPGPGSWLSSAAASQDGGRGAALVAAAERDATAWYADNRDIYQLGDKADYNAARRLVVGSGAGSNAAGYSALEQDLAGAISADRAVFQSGAARGANTLGPLAAVVIVASLLMAAGCGWAISRRLAEYR